MQRIENFSRRSLIVLWVLSTITMSFTLLSMRKIRPLLTRMSTSKLPFVAEELQRKLMLSTSISSTGTEQELLAEGCKKTTVKNTLSLAMKKKYPINAAGVKDQISQIKLFLGVSQFQVDVWFCSDTKMMQLNSEWRNKRKSTDILSFPANEFTSPGMFEEDASLEFEKHLGDLVVSPAYVMRVAARDQEDMNDGVGDDEDDAGVSKAMSTVFTLEERIQLLLVHGMLHLIGYDHETDSDWEVMTSKENEVITRLQQAAAAGCRTKQ